MSLRVSYVRIERNGDLHRKPRWFKGLRDHRFDDMVYLFPSAAMPTTRAQLRSPTDLFARQRSTSSQYGSYLSRTVRNRIHAKVYHQFRVAVGVLHRLRPRNHE